MKIDFQMVRRALEYATAEHEAGRDQLTTAFMYDLLQTALTGPDAKELRRKADATYSPELMAEILERIATTGHSLRKLTAEDPSLPDMATILRWVTAHSHDREYAKARDAGIDVRFDEVQALARTATGENAQAVRLMVDTEKWALSKLKPGKYGDRLDVNVSGAVTIQAMSDSALNDRVEARLRAKLEPVFDEIEHPTLDDVLRPFRVTPLPPLLMHDDTGGSE